MIQKPFEGIKVIELASVLAGPAVGMFFAELGAEVLKIENPKTNGDVTRQWKSKEESGSNDVSAYYQSVNWGKTSLFLDISTQDGANELNKILEKADVLLMNFKSGDAEKFKLDFQSLSKKFPRLICAYIFGYNENDTRPAFDLVMQAETGFMNMNGTLESGPLKMPVAIIDLMAAHQLKEGILTALYLREKNGRGNAVSVSLFDSAIASLANQAANFLVSGTDPQRMGSLHPNIAPYGETFLCSDGKYVVLAVGNEKQFSGFCIAIGKPGLISDPRFTDNLSRVKNRAELAKECSYFFLQKTAVEVAAIFGQEAVPFSVIKSVGEILYSKEASRLLIDNKVVRSAIFKIG
jgi:crotonobetainyl-CoA:carnitine CoA-transferase CaiB-like acyl-CoA transferase